MSLVLDNGSAAHVGYYMLNQQGDVIAILDETGGVAVKVVSYEYNAWGQIKEETATSTNVGTLFLEHNALKYRGYYYDAETGFYYVSSRYYDPVIGRFINADTTDVLIINPISLKNKNLYTYCLNNPVNNKDTTGAIAETVFDIVSLAGGMVEVIANPSDPWAWASLVGDTIDMIPVVSGCGEAMKALKLASEASDNLKTVGKITKKWKIGDPIDALTQAGNIPTWNTVRQRFWKNVGNALQDQLDEKTVNRLKRGLAPLNDAGNSLHLHHPNKRNTPEDLLTFGPVTPKEHFEWHMKYGF